ncbi:hypothetical protein [Lewinella cohaerens]|jgi:hypothetical protein|uniref:hypothetical protein n=1 Tax=Lewinella cohaerens TaxID=70995 RepID=UPI0003768568|nr:hypothetical protein [Lewinella cohaerens]
MPVVALLCQRHYGTGLSVAIAALYPLALRPPGPELRPAGLRTGLDLGSILRLLPREEGVT